MVNTRSSMNTVANTYSSSYKPTNIHASSMQQTTTAVSTRTYFTDTTMQLASISQSISTEVIMVSTTNEINNTPGDKSDPKPCLCDCNRCNNYHERKHWIENLNMTHALQEMRKELFINKTRLSSHRRKLISAFDGRKESTGIGVTLGVGLLCTVAAWVTIPDAYTLLRYLLKDRRIYASEA